MSSRMIVLAVVAFVSALGTTMMVRSWVASERAAAAAAPKVDVAPPPPMAEVLVAAEPLPAGMILKPQHLRWQTWPAQTVAEGYHIKTSGDMEVVVGSVVRNGIAKGEPVVEGRIVRPGDRGFLAAILTPGLRAVSIPINATSGIAGLIFPGDRVDVILTHTLNAEGQNERVRRASETVLEDIRVLATDQRTDHEDGSAGTVAKTATVEVTPKQAEILSMVTELGRLSLSLRSLQFVEGAQPQDQTAAATATAPAAAQAASAVVAPLKAQTPKQSYTLDNNVSVLLGGAAGGKGDPGRPAKPTRPMEVVRGNAIQQLNF